MSSPDFAVATGTSTTAGSATTRKLIDASFDDEEFDQTYHVSDSENFDSSSDSELSGDESGAESSATVSDFESLKGKLGDAVTIVDDKYVALKEEIQKEVVPQAQSLNSFLVKHEIPRKAFHSSIGFVTIYLYTCGFTTLQIAKPLWAIFAATTTFEILRLNSTFINEAVLPHVKYFVRENERDHINGIVFYLAGVSLVLTFAAKDIAVVSILLLSWADTAALTFGRAYGKYTVQVAPGKSLAGSLASFATGVLVCWLWYGYIFPTYGHLNAIGEYSWTPETSQLSFVQYALATGLITSVSEAVGVANIDDNFTIPVFSALFLTGLIAAFHA